MKHIPNILTMLRMILLPFMVYFLMQPGREAIYISLGIFMTASFTDFLDGYLARKYEVVTNIGKLLDPIADKLLVCAVLVTMVSTGEVAVAIVLIILSRDFAVSGLRAIAAAEGVVIHARKFGKIKMNTQVIALALLIGMRLYPDNVAAQQLANIMLYIATFFTVLSGADYFYNARSLFLPKTK